MITKDKINNNKATDKIKILLFPLASPIKSNILYGLKLVWCYLIATGYQE